MKTYVIRKTCIPCGHLKFPAIIKVDKGITQARCLQCNNVTEHDKEIDGTRLQIEQLKYIIRTKYLMWLHYIKPWEFIKWWKKGHNDQEIYEANMPEERQTNIVNWHLIKKKINETEIYDFD